MNRQRAGDGIPRARRQGLSEIAYGGGDRGTETAAGHLEHLRRAVDQVELEVGPAALDVRRQQSRAGPQVEDPPAVGNAIQQRDGAAVEEVEAGNETPARRV